MAKKPKRNKKQIMVAVLAAILALLMLLPMVFMIIENLKPAGAASSSAIRSQITDLKGKNKDIASQKSQLKSQLKSIQADKSKATEKKNLLERQIGLLQEEIANLDQQLEQYDLLIQEKEAEVAENEATEAAQFALFCKQCRAMEKEGAVSYWSILFSAQSFSDLLERVNTVNAIANYNDRVCDALQEARAALQAAREELVAAQEETQATRDSRDAARSDLKDQEKEVQKLIREIAADEKAAKAQIDKLEAAAKEMDAEIAKKEKELEKAIAAEKAAANGSNKYQFDPGTGFCWPLPKERVSVTSFFGYRKDPFTGNTSNHSGTDIGAYSGTEIYAAHGGVVITSGYHSSYGNYVVLSRGDGITTLYAHMNRRAVNEGQTVSQGQVIGYVGSTGRSTAPHLHYEVRVNGVRQDALKYYPNVKWKNNTGFPYN